MRRKPHGQRDGCDKDRPGHYAERKPEAQSHAERLRRLEQEPQRDGEARGGNVGQGFHGHAELQGRAGARHRAEGRAVARGSVDQQGHHGESKGELDIVMVEHARREDADIVKARRADEQRGQHGLAAGEAAHRAQQEIQRGGKEHRRPEHQRDRLARCQAAGHGRSRKNDGRDRRVDQSRPVHDEAVGRTHAVLGEIEPALAADQVADLDETQHAVIVGSGGKRRKPGSRLQRQKGQSGEQCCTCVADPAGQFVGRRGGQGHLVGGLQLRRD